VLYIVNMC